MTGEHGTSFGSIEAAHEYVGLLLEAVREAQQEIDEDLSRARGNGAARREQALQLVARKLERLDVHLATGRRLLNDLRTLRRLLLDERGDAWTGAGVAVPHRRPHPEPPGV
jgi:hypothetical protein